MQSKIIGGGIIVLIIIITVYFVVTGPAHAVKGRNASTTAQVTSTVAQNSTLGKLDSSSYAPFAYEVYPLANNSSQSHFVNSDFTLAIQNNTNGTATAVVKFSGGATYMFVVPAGYSLYHLDESIGDDSPTTEYSTNEDGFAIVDQNGTITQLDFPLQGATPTTSVNSTATTAVSTATSTSASSTTVAASTTATTASTWGG